MQFYLLILFFCFFLFLFYVHFSAKEDFVFIRKNVSLEQLFNVAFLTGIAALFTSRLFYVLYHPSVSYLNPLVFFSLPYFPGLTVSGALIGAYLFLLIYGRQQKLPTLRMGDIFSVGFLLIVPFGFLPIGIIHPQDLLLFSIASTIDIILCFFFIKFLIPKMMGGQFKDGTIFNLFMMNFPLLFLLSHIITRAALHQFYFLPEDIVLFCIFGLGLLSYLRLETSTKRRIAK
jgi:hypothetical protein